MRGINKVYGLGVALIIFSVAAAAVTAYTFTGQTTRVSVSSAGVPANASASAGVISGDGRYVVFMSSATNLVPGVSTGVRQVYRYDRLSHTTDLVSRSTTRNPGNNVSGDPSISADGRYVVFSSFATDLVDGDTNRMQDVFRRDMKTATTELVSGATPGVVGAPGGSGLSGLPGAREISDEGTYVVFTSFATNLVPGANGLQQVYRKDMTLGAVVLVSVNDATPAEVGDRPSQTPSISGNGLFVAFSSFATNFSPLSISGGIAQVFVRDLSLGLTTLEAPGAATADRPTTKPVLSFDGGHVAFESAASLDPDDRDSALDVYLRDRSPGGTTKLASRSLNTLDAPSSNPSISRDGRWVGFDSKDETMVDNDGNGTILDVFLYDDSDKTVTLVSLNDAGEAADAPSGGLLGGASISSNGHLVLFGSTASNLVGSTPGLPNQLYVRILGANQEPIVSLGSDLTITEGEPLRRIGRFSDTDASTSWIATVDFGAGPVDLALNPDKTFSLTHEPFTPGTYVVAVSVTDDAFATGTARFTLTVLPANRAPVVSAGADGTVTDVESLNRTGRFSDADASTSWKATVDYGAGPVDLALNPDKTFSLTHEPFTPGTYVVTVSVTDNAFATGTARFTLTVLHANRAPVVSAGADETVTEGDWLKRTGSFSDADGPTPWTATVDYGAGPVDLPLAADKTFWFTHEPFTPGPHVVKVSVTDNLGATGTVTFTHTVTNVAPGVDLGAEAFLYFDPSLHRLVCLTDPGETVPNPTETYGATVDYGDGSGSHPAEMIGIHGQCFWLDHTYAKAETYVVTATASDSNRGVGNTDTLTVHVFKYAYAWLEPLDDVFVVGRNLPVKFTVRASDGSFVLDGSVVVDVLDRYGNVVIDAYVYGDQPSRSVTSNGDSYHVNVDTKDLAPGTYQLRVRFLSPTLTGEFTLETTGLTGSTVTTSSTKTRTAR